MSEAETNVQEVQTGQADTATNPTETAKVDSKALTLDNVTKHYFPPAMLGTEEMVTMYTAIVGSEDAPSAIDQKVVHLNFDPTKDGSIPEGYGMLILPISERKEVTDGKGGKVNKRVNVSVAITVVPDPDFLLSREDGKKFARDSMLDSFQTKIGNALRPRQSDGKVSGNVPYSVEEFIEPRRGGAESLAIFNEIGKEFVTALKEKGLTNLTLPVLRQVVSSKVYAEAHFPKLEVKGQWEKVLDAMVARAKEKGKDPSIFENWKRTRTEVAAPDEIEDLDLEDLNLG